MTPAEVLKAAWSAVNEADLPEELHEIAFREAVSMYMLTSAPAGAVAHHTERDSSPVNFDDVRQGQSVPVQAGGGTAPASDLLAKVARGTGVPWQAIETLVYFEDDDFHVDLPAIKLGSSNAERTRNIAAVLTIVRTFSLDEDETPVDLIREEAHRLKCYDPSNFTTHLKGLEGFAIRGSGETRRVVAKAGGLDGFPKLVESLVGEG